MLSPWNITVGSNAVPCVEALLREETERECRGFCVVDLESRVALGRGLARRGEQRPKYGAGGEDEQ